VYVGLTGQAVLRQADLCSNLPQAVSKGDARRVGVLVAARLERGGREPRLTTLLHLADGLGVEPGELVNGLD